MPHQLVDEITKGDQDPTGQDVILIYAKNQPLYAVYRTAIRVMVQFADAPDEQAAQRARLAPLAPLRGQISGLIDGWRKGEAGWRWPWQADSSDRLRSRAEHLDRRVADAMIIALEGDIPNAAALLTEIRDEIIDERKSRSRLFYLSAASAASVAVLLLIWAFSSLFLPEGGYLLRVGGADVLNALTGGMIGAFFSIAIGLRSRTILTDFYLLSNVCDAVLRLVVGLIGALVIACLLGSGLVSGPGLNGKIANVVSSHWMFYFLAGFLAGFSERLIPDLLAKASFVTATGGAPSPSADAATAAAASLTTTGGAPPPTPARSAAGASGTASIAAVAPHAEDEVDACLCDSPPVAGEEVTHDAELPAAVGGVSADVVAPGPLPEDEPDGPDDSGEEPK